LKEFCRGLASVFPSTITVESDFSIINFEKNFHRSALTDLSLEGTLHLKQFDMVKKLKKDKNKDSETVHNVYKIQHNVITLLLFCETIYERRR